MVTVKVFAGATLAHGAGASRLRMIADGMPTGGIKSSYRTETAQQELYNGWVHRLPGYNFALPPSRSKHVQGLALDMIVTSAAHKWMLTHAAAYGWHRTNPAEAWHWEYSGVTPTPTAEDDDMPYTEQELTNFAANGTALALELNQAQNAVRNIVWNLTTINRDGKPVSTLQELADAKTQGIIANVKADQILAALAKVSAPTTASIDYAKLAKAVNDDAAQRMQG